MKKSLSKKLLCLITAASIMTTLSACKGKTETETATKNETKEPLKLTAMLISWGVTPPKDGVIEQEYEKRTNTVLDVTWVPYAEYTDRFNLLLASNDAKDVMQAYSSGGSLFYPQFVQAIKGGLFHDLTPYVTKDYIKNNSIMKDWSQSVWDNVTFNKKIYALPRYIQPIPSNSGIIVRKDLFDKAGLKEPTTLDELADVIIKLNKPGEYYGLQFSKNDFDATEVKAVAVAYTGVQDWGVDKEGNFTYQSFMPEYKDFLKWMKKLYDAKAIDPEFALGQYANSDFVKGKSALKMHTWWNWDQSEDGLTKRFFNSSVTPEARTWAFMPIKGPKAYTTGINPGFENPLVISSKVKKEDVPRVLEVVNGHTDDEFQKFLSYGTEGVHYTMENGKVKLTDENKKKKSEDVPDIWHMFFLKYNQDYVTEKFVNFNASAANVERVKQIRDAAEKAYKEYNISAPQLTLDAPSYYSKWNSITKDLKDNRVKVVMGKMTMEEWDKYVSDVTSSADYKKVLQEFKDSYNANKK
jgi:putative aldouronate transport system substrate-binding protein